MTKKIILLALCSLLFAPCSAADAQQPKKVPRIGYLSSGNPARDSARSEGMRLDLKERGHIQGQNIAIEYRYAEGKVNRFSELAAELIQLKVDIIVVAGGNRLILAAKNATKTIPIVMTGGGTDPVEAGLVESLARPGGNVTGITNLSGELGGKRLELLKEAVPKLAHVAVLYEPAAAPASVIDVKEVLPVAARALLAVKYRLPAIYFSKEFVDEGGLMSYGADYDDLFRRAAVYVDKILKGAKPADLPVQQATKFDFIINLKAAKQIGLTIPPNVLARADTVMK